MKININRKGILTVITVALIAAFTIGYSGTETNAAAPAKKQATQSVQQITISTTPLAIVNSPCKYLGRNVKFDATFDKFSTLGLDYKPALKKSQDYIGILIRRDDVTDHIVPLAEMKLFLPRKVAEKFIDIESGDKVQIQAKVFSNALGDPWLEITNFTITGKVNPKNSKK